jgi:hypothetical protein
MAATRTAIHTYSMQERAEHRDFEIRREGAREPLAQPHRHEYFQIQINLGGDTTQHIGASVRPFQAGMVSFVLPYRIHWVAQSRRSRLLRRGLACSGRASGGDARPASRPRALVGQHLVADEENRINVA